MIQGGHLSDAIIQVKNKNTTSRVKWKVDRMKRRGDLHLARKFEGMCHRHQKKKRTPTHTPLPCLPDVF